MDLNGAAATRGSVLKLFSVQTCSFRSAKGQTSLAQIKQKNLVRMTNTNNLPNPNRGTRRSPRNSPSIHEKLSAFTRATLNRKWLSCLAPDDQVSQRFNGLPATVIREKP